MDNEAYECPECLQKIPGAEMIIKRREAEKKEKRKKIFKTIGAAVLGIAFITGLTILVASLTRKESDIYMKPVKEYIKGCVSNEYDEYISAFPEFYQAMFNQQFAYIVIGDMTNDAEKIHTADLLYHDQYYRTLCQKYGEDFEITYTIHNEKQLIGDELTKYQEEYISFNPEMLADTKFEDGYELVVSFKISGNLGSNTVSDEKFRVIKINDKWYMMNYVDFTYEKEDTNLSNMR